MKLLNSLSAGVTGDEKSKEASNSDNTDKTSPLPNTSIATSWEFDGRMIQNFRLVWLDSSIDEVNGDDTVNTIKTLRQVVNTVRKFTNVTQCIEFMAHVQDEKIFMICSGELGQTTIPLVHDMFQINCVYIFCKHKARHEQWAKEWFKVKGVYTDIIPICQALKQAAQDCDYNSTSISFVKSTNEDSQVNLDTLDKSFMYMQILKEILLTIDFKQEDIKEFVTYYREQLAGNTAELKNVDRIEKEYCRYQSILWYTYECFLYSMLNRALRLLDVDLIIKMGFFVRDLHNQIVELHAEQYGEFQRLTPFTIYRGQGLSQTDFDQLKNTEGGLLSFNNFLSTSKNRDFSLNFACRTIASSNLIGVLFILKIDPSISAAPFADVQNVSYDQEKEEILFSMHAVFRIGHVEQIENNDRLWQVDLSLTSDSGPQLHALTEMIRGETFSSFKRSHQLGKLMIKLGHINKAEELYEILLKQTRDESEKAHLFHQLGWLRNDQGKYAEAIGFYEKSLEIYQKTLPENHPDLATSYSDIGLVYTNMGEYSKALLYHEKDLQICQETLPLNHLDLAISYHWHGYVYGKMGEYSKALSYTEKALEIYQNSLSADHPHLATSYNTIGSVYWKMGDYSKALSYCEKVLEIDQKTVLENHPSLATSYNNIGLVYDNMGEYSNALSYYENAFKIRQKTLPANHPDLATSYKNIGRVYRNMNDYSKALLYFERALDIWERSLPPNHPDLQSVREIIEIVKEKL